MKSLWLIVALLLAVGLGAGCAIGVVSGWLERPRRKR